MTSTVLPDRVNAQPPILRGCSSSELLAILLLSALFWLPASLLLAASLGAVTMAFGISGVGILATVFVMATLFQRIKRNRPDGFYVLQVYLWLHDHHIKSSGFIRRSGDWDLGRTKP